jgi:hypothetical protein
VVIVSTDEAVVEADLLGGRLSCPDCGGALGPWGSSTWRDVRLLDRTERRRPRRSTCRACSTSSGKKKTHVLAPEDTLLRRRDGVEVIGAALTAKARGESTRDIADDLGRPVSTVGGWVRSLGAMAGAVRDHFTRWAHVLGPCHDRPWSGGSAFCDAVEAVGMVGIVAVRRFGPRPAWLLASVLTGGRLISNTGASFAPPG